MASPALVSVALFRGRAWCSALEPAPLRKVGEGGCPQLLDHGLRRFLPEEPRRAVGGPVAQLLAFRAVREFESSFKQSAARNEKCDLFQCGSAQPNAQRPPLPGRWLGSRIFLGGGIGYVVGSGTQHHPGVPRTERGIPQMGSDTLSVTGDLRQMSARWPGVRLTRNRGSPLPWGSGCPFPSWTKTHSTMPR